MNLKVYLATVRLTLKDFCTLVNYNYRYMSRVMNGHLMPSQKLRKEIHKITGTEIDFSANMQKKMNKVKKEA